MGLGILTNHFVVDEEYTMGSSVGSFDSITYGKNLWIHFCKYIIKGRMMEWLDQDVVHEYKE